MATVAVRVHFEENTIIGFEKAIGQGVDDLGDE